jgi:hypothetical protein
MMNDYEELATRAANSELTVKPGTVLRGSAASKAGQQALMQATAAATPTEAVRIALGRPQLGHEGRSPVVRARVPKTLKAEVTELAAVQGRRESEIVREAVATYVQAHRAA